MQNFIQNYGEEFPSVVWIPSEIDVSQLLIVGT